MVNNNKGCGSGGMHLAEQTASAKALRCEEESRRRLMQCVWDSGHRVGGEAGESPEISLVLWTVGESCSFSYKLNGISPASSLAIGTGQS